MTVHPDVEEFKRIILKNPLDKVVEEYIFRGVPYVFRTQPEAMETLQRHLANALGLNAVDVTVIGSARIGFSLSPDNFPRQFSDDSDIDILVVNDRLFDDLWKTILKWNYPRRYQLPLAEWRWVRNGRMEDVYWGWFRPDQIKYEGLLFPEVLKPMRDISTSWFDAFRSLSTYPEFATRNISGRLYRTWDHARLYHVEGLRQLTEIVREIEGRR